MRKYLDEAFCKFYCTEEHLDTLTKLLIRSDALALCLIPT